MSVAFVRYLLSCILAYRKLERYGVVYFAVESHGVPQTVVMVARGRSAWKLSEFAIESAALGLRPEAAPKGVEQ
jgi:hypothetical protein